MSYLSVLLQSKTAVNRQKGSSSPMEMQRYNLHSVPLPVQLVTLAGKILLPGCQSAVSLSHCTSCRHEIPVKNKPVGGNRMHYSVLE